jgi:competence protein ComEA
MHRLLAVIVYACAAVAVAAADVSAFQAKPAKAKAAATTAAPLNLNTATLADLEALPGVGASTAKLIIEHRQKTGGFKKVEELMNIKGIGEKSFLKLKSLVTVAPEKTDKADRPESKGGDR